MRSNLEKLPLYVLLDCCNLSDQLLLVSEMSVDAQNIFAEIHYEFYPILRNRTAIGVKLITYLSWPWYCAALTNSSSLAPT